MRILPGKEKIAVRTITIHLDHEVIVGSATDIDDPPDTKVVCLECREPIVYLPFIGWFHDRDLIKANFNSRLADVSAASSEAKAVH